MRSLMILVATTAVVSGLRETTPGFAVDYRSFGGSSSYQDLPYREQTRSFRETVQPTGQHQPFRQDAFREYRPPAYGGREETRLFRDETRGAFKEDPRIYKNDNRESGFKDELRNFNDVSRPFREDARGVFKDESRGFREDIRQSTFRDDRMFRDEIRGMREGPPRHFRDERPFREEHRPYREEIRSFRDENARPFRDEARPFRDEARPFRDEARPFRDDIRGFEEGRNYRDDMRSFRNEGRPFREETTIFRDDRPFREESGPVMNEPRPFREESGPFKDELMFTQESQSLAEAHHRFNKEQKHRQPLSFGGHSSYLKYGNHGLGFASVPAAILPLEDNSRQSSSDLMMSEMSTTAVTGTPDYSKSELQATSSPGESSSETKGHVSVTLAPDVGSTPSQSTSGNAITSHTVDGHHRTNENLVDGASTIPTSSAVTISTSGGTSVTPKVVYTSGSASMSDSGLGITTVDSNGHQTHGPPANSLRPSKPDIQSAAAPDSYFPSETRAEVPEALLKYVFKYQIPEDIKTRYTYQPSPQTETFNQVQTLPLMHHHDHHQPTKYTILPELKISDLATMRQPGGSLNYAPTVGLPKVTYLPQNSPTLNLGSSYSTQSGQPVNYAGNQLLQLDQNGHFTQLLQTDHLNRMQGQTDQYPQIGQQLVNSDSLSQLGHYSDLGQAQQTRNGPFTQGGLQLQLGGFGGIDYSALSSNSVANRGSPGVGLAMTELSRPVGSTFGKIAFGQSLW